ncbi:hypothetical protein AB0B94_30520 [Micromonospora sp. NPDC048986]|uniref:hypothetical protein n=1 Tax=Micromonospora sp. NPDC048986 TaxID=3155644 RepID=UPI0033FF735C
MITDAELRHGYTLADVSRLSRVATRMAGTFAADYTDLTSWAWSAIVEYLYAADHWPPEHRLIEAGKRAVWDSVRVEQREHGGSSRANYEPGSMAAFQRYWWAYNAVVSSPEDAIVERTALRQVLPLLTTYQHQALSAVAAHDGDVDAAAAALGVNRSVVTTRLQAARKRVLGAWHEGGTPPRGIWRRSSPGSGRPHVDRTAPEHLGGHCGRGHLFDRQNTAVRANGKRECRRCVADAAGRRRRAQTARTLVGAA